MALDLALNPEDLGDDFEDEGEGFNDELSEAGQQEAKRNLEKIKKEVKDKVKKQVQKVAKKLASKVTVRVVSLACGATGVGLIVTYIIWTGQAIIANWMGKDRIIPKLDWWELVLWGILTIILLFLLLMLLIFLIVGAAISNPLIGVTILGTVVWNWITG